MNRNAPLMEKNTHPESFCLLISLCLEWNNRTRLDQVKEKTNLSGDSGVMRGTICSDFSYTCSLYFFQSFLFRYTQEMIETERRFSNRRDYFSESLKDLQK